ncbi:MAG: peptidoglycan-binding protein [Acetobacteraceae bacterium]|nr:peptidoglycan-binding protein [Acetobacteraceae bacterium]
MRTITVLAGAALAGTLLTSSAMAQQTAPLAYVQPLTNQAVALVQDHLRQAGAYSGAVDGVWGTDSEAALQRFQQNHQLQVTGQLNQATVASLGLDPAALIQPSPAAQVPPVPPAATLRPSSVRAVQARLRSLGFYSGAVDGVWGAGTQQAIEQFQQGRGLQPNGQLNPATITAMGLSPDSLAYR